MTGTGRISGAPTGADAVPFVFEGRTLKGHAGESLAAALTAAGERALRQTAKGRFRGLFCGMGVCQECLVEVDGLGNQRACMTKLDAPCTVHRQVHRAGVAEPPAPRDPRTEVLTPDILVVGGGAGGLNAATAAARMGAEVLLVDERSQPGGQFYKQPLEAQSLPPFLAEDPQITGGRALIERAVAAGVRILSGAQVWGAFEPLDLMIHDGAGSVLCRPRRLIVATGAYERGLPLPGWTLPGVMTTGAAQTLLRSYQVLAGRRVLIAGNGPLNLQVAVELAQAGAEVAAVAELACRPGPWAAGAIAQMLASVPTLVLRGRDYVAELRRRGIPLLYSHVLRSVEPSGAGLRAEIAPWPAGSGDGLQAFDVDVVCMGYGFMPSNEILRALGCRHVFDRHRGQLVTQRNGDCLTSVDNVYAVGDCTGLGGAPAAEAEGLIAGLAAARSLGLPMGVKQRAAARAARIRLGRHRRFQAALWRLFSAPQLLTELARPDTILCRCEELTLAEIEAGFDENSSSIGAVKRGTRAGMGRCQGRYCGPIVAAVAAARQGIPLDEAAHWAPRPPIKPIPISDIAGR